MEGSFSKHIGDLLDNKPKNKIVLCLIYYPLLTLVGLVAMFLISYVLPQLVAWLWAASALMVLILLPIIGVIYLVGFLVKKWLLS